MNELHLRRSAPIELIGFAADAARFIDAHGRIAIEPSDVERRCWQGRMRV